MRLLANGKYKMGLKRSFHSASEICVTVLCILPQLEGNRLLDSKWPGRELPSPLRHKISWSTLSLTLFLSHDKGQYESNRFDHFVKIGQLFSNLALKFGPNYGYIGCPWGQIDP